MNSWQQSWSGMFEIGQRADPLRLRGNLVLVHPDQRAQDLERRRGSAIAVRFSSVCEATWPITSPVTSARARQFRASRSAIRSISRR